MRVAITAAETRTALGRDLDATWAQLEAGASAVAALEGTEADAFPAARGARIWHEAEGAEDDPALRILGSHGQLLDGVAAGAHARGRLERVARERVGLFVGMGMVDSRVEELAPAVLAARGRDGALDLRRFFGGAYRSVHPLWPLSMLNNVAVGQIAMDLDIRGDNVVLASDGVAGLRALLEGARAVHAGTADAVLAGGVGERISLASLTRHALRGLPQAGDALGEGAAALALHAAPDEAAPALGYLRGGATAFGEGALARAAGAALADAGLEPAAIEVACLPGEGPAEASTPECEALVAAGCGDARTVTTRAALGNTLAAAAAIDVALALRAGEARHVLVLAAGSAGGAGALVLEAA